MPFPFAAVGTGIAAVGGLIDAFKGPSEIEQNALKRYKELTDFSSPYWRQAMRFFQRSLSDAAPTIDTLTQFANSRGIEGSEALAYQQNKTQTNRNQNTATQSLMGMFLQSGQEALGFLNTAGSLETDRFRARRSFLNQALGLGGSLLTRRSNQLNDFSGSGEEVDTDYHPQYT
jgi:hypothetical protein